MGANDIKILISAQDQATPTLRQVSGAATGMAEAAKTAAAAFAGWQVTAYLGQAVKASEQYQNSLRGLASVARYAGEDLGQSMQAASQLTADGLLSVQDAATSLKNLLSRGFSLNESIQMLERLKDAAAFGRQASLSLGEAVRSATEGIKNENSILVDNAGVTKNVSVMWKEYASQIGTTTDKLSLAQKREAEMQGIMRETEAQMGNSALAAAGLTGQYARLEKAQLDFQVQLGQSLAPLAGTFAEFGTSFLKNFVTPFLAGLEISSVRLAGFLDKIDRIGGQNLWDMVFNPADTSDIDANVEALIAEIVAKYESGVLPEIGKDTGKRLGDGIAEGLKLGSAATGKRLKDDERSLSQAMARIKRQAQEVKEAEEEAARAATAAWSQYTEVLDELTVASLPEHQRQVYQIERAYDALEEKLITLVEITGMSSAEADQWQAKLRQNADQQLAALKQVGDQHQATTAEITTVWDSALSGIDRGLDEWVRNGQLSADSLQDAFGAAIRGIVADWLRGMATMSARSPQMSSIGGTAAVYATMAGTAGGSYGGLLAGGAGIVNELFNPGAYGSALGGLQNNLAWGLSDMGMDGAASWLDGLSGTSFGAGTAGIGTFVSSLLSGQGFGQAAASGAGSAAGFALGSMTPLGPIGGIIGSIAGSMLGGVFGGGGESTFTLSELSGLTDNTWSRTGGFVTDINSGEPDGARPTTTYLSTIASVQEQFDSQVEALKGTMSSAAWEAFAAALERRSFEENNAGRWNSSEAGQVVSQIASDYAAALTQGLNDALVVALQIDAVRAPLAATASAITTSEASSEVAAANQWYITQRQNIAEIQGLLSAADFTAVISDLLTANDHLYQQIRDKWLAPISEAYAHYSVSAASRELEAANQWYTTQRQNIADIQSLLTVGQYETKIAELLAANSYQYQEIKDKWRAPVAELLKQHDSSDLARSLETITSWQEEQIANAEALRSLMSASDYSSWLDDIALAAQYQTDDLIDKWITPVTSQWKNFFDEISLSDLAPVQSREGYQARYESLLMDATDGGGNDQQAIADLFNFVKSDYLPFMQQYGTDYQQTWDQMFGQGGTLRNLTVDLGEINTQALATAVSQALAPYFAQVNGESHVVINIDGRELGNFVAEQVKTNPNLIAALN